MELLMESQNRELRRIAEQKSELIEKHATELLESR